MTGVTKTRLNELLSKTKHLTISHFYNMDFDVLIDGKMEEFSVCFSQVWVNLPAEITISYKQGKICEYTKNSGTSGIFKYIFKWLFKISEDKFDIFSNDILWVEMVKNVGPVIDKLYEEKMDIINKTNKINLDMKKKLNL